MHFYYFFSYVLDEIGHNFGMNHDRSPCPTSGFVMAAGGMYFDIYIFFSNWYYYIPKIFIFKKSLLYVFKLILVYKNALS